MDGLLAGWMETERVGRTLHGVGGGDMSGGGLVQVLDEQALL